MLQEESGRKILKQPLIMKHFSNFTSYNKNVKILANFSLIYSRLKECSLKEKKKKEKLCGSKIKFFYKHKILFYF